MHIDVAYNLVVLVVSIGSFFFEDHATAQFLTMLRGGAQTRTPEEPGFCSIFVLLIS
jgi:hypothetical protein